MTRAEIRAAWGDPKVEHRFKVEYVSLGHGPTSLRVPSVVDAWAQVADGALFEDTAADAAARVLDLINSSPKTPSVGDIAAAIGFVRVTDTLKGI